MALSEAQINAVIDRADRGESLTGLAEEYGVTRQAVRGLLRRRGIPPRRSGRLTDHQREAVVRRYLEGASIAQIAREVGVSEPSVRGLLLRRGVPLRVHTLNHGAFDELTPTACYWAGFLFADGSVTARQGHLPTVSVGLAECDRDHLVALRTFLGSTSSISAPNPKLRSCQFAVRSTQLADRLLQLGRYTGSVNEQLTSSRDFWRGVVDGDGSIGAYAKRPGGPLSPQFRLVGRPRLLEPFVDFLSERVSCNLTVRPHKTIATVGTTGRPARGIIDLLYRDAETALSRKAERAAAIVRAGDHLVLRVRSAES
ncbi:RNA polymerase sigma factor [Micromonospora siamensis]|uniref:Sigma-70, region 4 n=1 Tax=Micromonospora siamensis TaxID=299152 RepID=A0A1C5GUM3_9ACTN|nr:sigma-70 region 4 domain-containing protein [Micromonospora siamensis]SCG37478.1 Sigma-70, region 4 [Micromonospora siamensis]